MTQKDFELIAAVIAKLGSKLPQRTHSYIAVTFADRLSQENPRFDRAVFMAACGLSKAWQAALT